MHVSYPGDGLQFDHDPLVDDDVGPPDIWDIDPVEFNAYPAFLDRHVSSLPEPCCQKSPVGVFVRSRADGRVDREGAVEDTLACCLGLCVGLDPLVSADGPHDEEDRQGGLSRALGVTA